MRHEGSPPSVDPTPTVGAIDDGRTPTTRTEAGPTASNHTRYTNQLLRELNLPPSASYPSELAAFREAMVHTVHGAVTASGGERSLSSTERKVLSDTLIKAAVTSQALLVKHKNRLKFGDGRLAGARKALASPWAKLIGGAAGLVGAVAIPKLSLLAPALWAGSARTAVEGYRQLTGTEGKVRKLLDQSHAGFEQRIRAQLERKIVTNERDPMTVDSLIRDFVDGIYYHELKTLFTQENLLEDSMQARVTWQTAAPSNRAFGLLALATPMDIDGIPSLMGWMNKGTIDQHLVGGLIGTVEKGQNGYAIGSTGLLSANPVVIGSLLSNLAAGYGGFKLADWSIRTIEGRSGKLSMSMPAATPVVGGPTIPNQPSPPQPPAPATPQPLTHIAPPFYTNAAPPRIATAASARRPSAGAFVHDDTETVPAATFIAPSSAADRSTEPPRTGRTAPDSTPEPEPAAPPTEPPPTEPPKTPEELLQERILANDATLWSGWLATANQLAGSRDPNSFKDLIPESDDPVWTEAAENYDDNPVAWANQFKQRLLNGARILSITTASIGSTPTNLNPTDQVMYRELLRQFRQQFEGIESVISLNPTGLKSDDELDQAIRDFILSIDLSLTTCEDEFDAEYSAQPEPDPAPSELETKLEAARNHWGELVQTTRSEANSEDGLAALSQRLRVTFSGSNNPSVSEVLEGEVGQWEALFTRRIGFAVQWNALLRAKCRTMQDQVARNAPPSASEFKNHLDNIDHAPKVIKHLQAALNLNAAAKDLPDVVQLITELETTITQYTIAKTALVEVFKLAVPEGIRKTVDDLPALFEQAHADPANQHQTLADGLKKLTSTVQRVQKHDVRAAITILLRDRIGHLLRDRYQLVAASGDGLETVEIRSIEFKNWTEPLHKAEKERLDRLRGELQSMGWNFVSSERDKRPRGSELTQMKQFLKTKIASSSGSERDSLKKLESERAALQKVLDTEKSVFERQLQTTVADLPAGGAHAGKLLNDYVKPNNAYQLSLAVRK